MNKDFTAEELEMLLGGDEIFEQEIIKIDSKRGGYVPLDLVLKLGKHRASQRIDRFLKKATKTVTDEELAALKETEAVKNFLTDINDCKVIGAIMQEGPPSRAADNMLASKKYKQMVAEQKFAPFNYYTSLAGETKGRYR